MKPIQDNTLNSTWLKTQLGPMLAIADSKHLFLLEFHGRKGLDQEIERLIKKTGSEIIEGRNGPINSIESEIDAYFSGKLQQFKTPIHMFGTPFQQKVWKALMQIPFGETKSYKELAEAIEKPTAFRAVAQANGKNQLAIIIPCHRVINSNGNLGGYGGGLSNKKSLLIHEGSGIICK
ncbi:MAG: methylated-DNA--[protein]-cysteine S-methyltransferase [Chlamydiota bacterium]|nr:methylated-DNA--[protein]-cysteine S-methyltransferase [Chlamydiota bacterium]